MAVHVTKMRTVLTTMDHTLAAAKTDLQEMEPFVMVIFGYLICLFIYLFLLFFIFNPTFTQHLL